uniref:Uncharacterized protein n=1 Tax=Brassica oleracea var. oleracea TaxID=109376 RepID=A0A0D3DWD0_BRAOL
MPKLHQQRSASEASTSPRSKADDDEAEIASASRNQNTLVEHQRKLRLISSPISSLQSLFLCLLCSKEPSKSSKVPSAPPPGTQVRFKQAEETTKKLDLDGLVVIGGDDSNTNACLLAENFSLVVIWYKYGLEDEELLRMLLRLFVPDQSDASSGHKLKISDVLSGGQAPGGHNVITGLLASWDLGP